LASSPARSVLDRDATETCGRDRPKGAGLLRRSLSRIARYHSPSATRYASRMNETKPRPKRRREKDDLAATELDRAIAMLERAIANLARRVTALERRR
jgi:hypothetical protein